MQTPEQIIIFELQRLIRMQAEEIKMLKVRITDLEKLVEQNSGPRKNSNNSSTPPSKDDNRPKRTNSLREQTNRKVGGQPGHEGKTLEMTAHPDEIVEHRACFCPDCGKDLTNQTFELSGKRQVIDIPVIKHIVTEHQVYRCTCPCGKLVESDFPVGVDSPVRYGKNIEALIGYLSVRQYLPFKWLQEMLHDLFSVPISEGGLHRLLNRLASKGVDAYEIIRKRVLRSGIVGADETGMKVNGKKYWFWTWQNKFATFIAASTNRGTATIEEYLDGIDQNTVLVHDCWKAHFQTPVNRH
jgi:transposase